jgi:metal-responsive CopG/Arc/MetJ family transcriptional regulator
MKVKKSRKIGYKTISMPKNLYEKVDETIENTGFANVSQFVSFVMRMILSDSPEGKDKDMEKKVKTRLKSLGYL